jgi:urease accessory protein
MNPRGYLAALQLADSALPVGRFAHSYGLEALLRSEPALSQEELDEIVETLVVDAVAPLDGAAVARAHDLADRLDLDGLCSLDRCVSARKLTPGSRRASTACGRNLAALIPLLSDASPVAMYAARVRNGTSDGNIAVLEGALSHALLIRRLEAVLIELRSVASSFLSAAIRLGCLSAAAAQASLHRLTPALVEAALSAEELREDQLRSVAPELDIHLIAHDRLEARLFAN